MADWIVCASCSLKHSAREDGICPRCGAAVRSASAKLSASPSSPSTVSPVVREIADAQKSLLRAFVGTLVTFGAVGGFLVTVTSRPEPAPGWIFLAGNVVLWGAMVFMARAAYRVACAIGAGSPGLWAVGSFLAPLNLLLVLALSSRATEELRRMGVPVGFLGPKLE